MDRRHLLPLALVALTLISGCAGLFGSQPISDDRLDEEPSSPYAWESDADVHITITENAQFQAVYRPDGASMELFRRDGFGGQNAIPVSAVRYRYPNGTVITGTEIRNRGGEIERSRERVSIRLPADAPEGEGRLGFVSSSTPKRFSLPTFVEGSYVVVLPPDRRVEVFPFGKIDPGSYEVGTDGDRRVIRWEAVEADAVSVQFYLQRDLLLFGAAAAILVGVGAGGALYYRRRIEALRRRRKELGLDVDTGDDEFRDDPPPGMG